MQTPLLNRVDAGRLQQLTLDLTCIRSYTGDTREVAEAYARHLEETGLDVETVRDHPQSPCVVGRLRGTGTGPALEFNGHLDTVPVDHPAPYVAEGRIHGRGAADMKGGLAAMAEAARVIAESGIRMRGDLLLVAHGLHEAPDGHGEDLLDLVRRGIKGDAAIFINHGKIPAIYHGPGGQGAHGDLESVALADLVRAARVYVLTALRYVGCETG